MTTGVILLNFGEPAEPDPEVVLDYLTRIFLANAPLEGVTTETEAEERARELAERRAPALIEEYEEIGGSPLPEQADEQAGELAAELGRRGYDVTVHVGMQYTEPFIGAAVERARAAGADRLVGLPAYPLCGPSTTVQSLAELSEALIEADWDVQVDEIAGWHKHPRYTRLRADNVAAYARERGLDLAARDTALVFSAHGTPRRYLEQGSRYDRYVEEYCAVQARVVGAGGYELGWQNHENRDIPWTEPDIEALIERIDADRVLVEPVSFVHEQSETLSELDIELRAEAEDAGIEFHRVPVPHDDDRLARVLADLVEPFAVGVDPLYYNLHPCLCRDAPDAVCLNAGPNRVYENCQGADPTPVE